MQDMEKKFLAHVSINQRIYEISLENKGMETEKLLINSIPFPEFSQIEVDEILNKRSIIIENHLVHFYEINGVISIELEPPEMNKSSLEEKLAAPCFPIISQIQDNDGYYNQPEQKKAKQRSNLIFFIYGVIICFAYLYNPSMGALVGIFICKILDFLVLTYSQYKIAKEFPRDQDRWL